MSSRPRGSCRGSRQLPLLLKVLVLLVLPLLEVLLMLVLEVLVLPVLLIRRITGN